MISVNLTGSIQDLVNGNSSITIQISDLVTAILIIILIIIILLSSFFRNRTILYGIKEFTINFPTTTITYEIPRDYDNIEIAHKIYTELITRKAAIPIDVDNDVIIEIYNSWYDLFRIIREEIKNIPGENIRNKSKSEPLVRMATDILNKGLRPHLTKYQAKFRKWYYEQLDSSESKGKSPQNIQKNYLEYNELIADMKVVNILLLEYSSQLKSFIDGKK